MKEYKLTQTRCKQPVQGSDSKENGSKELYSGESRTRSEKIRDERRNEERKHECGNHLYVEKTGRGKRKKRNELQFLQQRKRTCESWSLLCSAKRSKLPKILEIRLRNFHLCSVQELFKPVVNLQLKLQHLDEPRAEHRTSPPGTEETLLVLRCEEDFQRKENIVSKKENSKIEKKILITWSTSQDDPTKLIQELEGEMKRNSSLCCQLLQPKLLLSLHISTKTVLFAKKAISTVLYKLEIYIIIYILTIKTFFQKIF